MSLGQVVFDNTTTMIIMTLLSMTISITFNTGDITYNDININDFTYE
jgi:hypothetical protein